MHTTQTNRLCRPSPEFGEGRKFSGVQKAALWTLLENDPHKPSRVLLQEMAQTHGPIGVSERHLNRVRQKWNRSGPKGRPRKSASGSSHDPPASLAKVAPHLSHIGVHLFDAWMEHENGFGPVVERLQLGIGSHLQRHPEEAFALLQHREETLKTRFKALVYAPLFGIGKLSEFDYQEHPLETVLGRTYQSSTLNQFLGQLERIDAGPWLMPALLPAQSGKIGYIDGHMMAFWTSVSMHKGKITNVGRIMAGSQAVISHDETGHALLAAYYPPDIRLPRVIVAYCEDLSQRSGIEMFVIDREVNALEMARAFRDRGWGLLCMLDRNQYKGLESFDTNVAGHLDDGSVVYEGTWHEAKKDDPRRFVLVEEAERLLVYWGTPKVKEVIEPIDWPTLYRQRTEIQENSFKSMKDHGALDVNFGTKKIVVADRHQQRAKAALEEDVAKASQQEAKRAEQVQERQEKVEESEQKGHTKRLVQRQAHLVQAREELDKATEKKATLQNQLESLGPDQQRADRDFRKQSIMTFRTLFLENALLTFLKVLLGHMTTKICLQTLLKVLFERGGTRVESDCRIIYWVNTQGLSCRYQDLLGKVLEGINALGLNRAGKPIEVRARDGPS
ncbi:MAG: hypothetical protein ACYTGS_18625 [Planctomycetota bacterium]|jgi:hypothetical protein